MYHKKKIALFLSHIYGIYQRNLCQGIVSRAAYYGYNTEIYTTSDGENLGDYSLGEASILKIPNWQDIEGIVFASGTYTDDGLRNHICGALKKTGLTVVEITESEPTFPRIALENNLTAGTLTAHMIDVHNAKNICYLGCSKEAGCSLRRQKAFLSVMRQHALPVSEANCYACAETPEDYQKALEQFCSINGNPPDAILCYNDRIALGLYLAASRAGYRIPEDFGITGCDNTPEGQNLIPPLTTVTFPTYQVGAASVDALFAILQKKTDYATTVFAEPVYGGSCGCSYRPSSTNLSYICQQTDQIIQMEHSTFRSIHMSTAFSHITDIETGMDALEKYIGDIEHCSEFYLCLYSDWDRLTDPILELTGDGSDEETQDDPSNTVLLELGMKNGRRLPSCSFEKNTLLPAFLNDASDAAYIVSPLFFESQSFGYVVMAFQDNQMAFSFSLVPFIVNITQLLANICDNKRTHILTRHLEDLYLRDMLTGLYNRYGFDQHEQALLRELGSYQYLHVLVFDLDELKTINDLFGHEAGDFALKAIGQALLSTAPADAVCSRFGGDEFYCLLPGSNTRQPEEFSNQITQYLDHFNKLSSKPYNVSVSCGYATAETAQCHDSHDVQVLFETADQNMYAFKKSKEKHILKA